MVIGAVNQAAVQPRHPADNHTVLGGFDLGPQQGQVLGHHFQPVAFLQAQSPGVVNLGHALGQGSHHRQGGDQIGDFSGVDINAAQPAVFDTGQRILHRNAVLLHRHLCPEPGHQIRHRLVPLGRMGRQAGDCHRTTGERPVG